MNAKKSSVRPISNSASTSSRANTNATATSSDAAYLVAFASAKTERLLRTAGVDTESLRGVDIDVRYYARLEGREGLILRTPSRLDEKKVREHVERMVPPGIIIGRALEPGRSHWKRGDEVFIPIRKFAPYRVDYVVEVTPVLTLDEARQALTVFLHNAERASTDSMRDLYANDAQALARYVNQLETAVR